AQLSTGTISGTVKDQSAAVLPGATVTVTNVETGITRVVESGGTGQYRVPNLIPGSYEVQAESAGFQTGIRSGITLSVGRQAVVDITLRVGDVAERVTVTGEAPLIETTTATVSGVVEQQQMRDIPLNARSFLELVPLQTGATFTETGGNSAVQGFGKRISIVGARYNQNSFLLDGADINDMSQSAGSAGGTMAGVETVREFRVVTNAYDTEYGRHTGGVITAVTKSGTNEIHGSLFEFLRNDNFDARNFFDPEEPPAFVRNQFGGSVGGPIIRDRTFFFGSFEGLRERLGRTLTFNVPGRDARNGIFDGEFIGVDPATKPYIDAYWLPNTPDRADGTARFIQGFSQPLTQDFVLGRVDHRFSDSDSIFGRFNFDSADRFRPGANGMNTGEQTTTESRFMTLEETHIYSPQFIGRTHISLNRTLLTATDPALAGSAAFPQFSFSDVDDVPGHINISGLTAWGGRTFNPKKHAQTVYQFKEDFFYSTGRHSIKFGGQFERFQANVRSDFNASGTFGFGSLDDFMLNDVASFLVTQPGADNIRGWRQSLFGFYLQDDISVKPGFTLNLGVRYEAISVPTEVNGKVASIRDWTRAQEGFGPATGHFYSVKPSETDVGDPYFENPSLKNFAPRVGFAWDPFQTGKTSVRGGVGLFHDQILPHVFIFLGARVAPFFSVADVVASDLPETGINFPDAFNAHRDLLSAEQGGTPQVDLVQHFVEQPTMYKWSMDIQREVAPDTTVDIGYSGTRGTHLWRGAILLNTIPAIQRDGRRFILIREPRSNPNWGRMRVTKTDGTSQYHAFRASLTKRFSRGFQIQSSYTLSKMTDDSSSTFGSTDFRASDRRGYRGEKENALSSFDIRHSFYTNFVYDFPTGNLTGAAGKVLGGWGVSSILRFNSGSPFNLSGDQPRDGRFRARYVDGPRLNLVAGGDQNPVRPQNPDEYYDVSQFIWPGAVTGTVGSESDPRGFFQGTVGRNTTITPGIANIDFTLMKETPLWSESTNLQFRAEFFNIFNRPNFARPATNLFTRTGSRRSNAGEITSTTTTSRQIQLALRLVF
ncbi:MAG: TonB-dependent receptor, partial [Acidobacteria bacterium]|nr:TonB-dependent receptor [Acidobacteriota bacterium]